MRSKTFGWSLAVITALVVAVTIALALSGRQGNTDDVATQDVAPTTTSEGPSADPASGSTTRPPPLAATTTTASAAATTTTSPPEATSTTVQLTTPSGYTWLPKPDAGPNTVAPGGALTKHLVEDIAIAFGFEITEVEAALATVELPREAEGNPEGWLAPGTYQSTETISALELVQSMVDRRLAQLEEREIPRDRWHRVITAASVIEKETYNQNEKPNVARVLNNRLAGGGKLQMDSIILYPVPEDRIFTTTEERSSDQPYNSYRHNGLPPTPICSPDEASLDAFLSPPPGDWWFYVTIDLHSGETRYSVTSEEHLTNVELLRAWLEDNPTA